MRRLKLFSLFCLLFASTLAFAEEQEKQYDIEYSLADSKMEWVLGRKDEITEEFFLPGENQKKWSELFTVHRLLNTPISFEAYCQAFLSQIQQIVPNSRIENRIIKKDDKTIMGEWWIHDKTPNAQHEWYRVLSKGKDLYILRFTTKRIEKSKDVGKLWESILEQAKVVEKQTG